MFRAKTCVNRNGFLSNYFSVSRSVRHECSIAPLIYSMLAEPKACAIRATPNIKVLSIPGENIKETKLNMLADDMQLFNKTEKSIEESFDV